jgi:putative ABC transport system permease protein
MKDMELIELAANSLRHRKLRSWLAILGIVIGVASVISLISISVGLNSSIQSSLGGLGANIITITSGAARAGRTSFGGGGGAGFGAGFGGQTTQPITFEQANDLKRIAGVEYVDPRLQKNEHVTYKNLNTSVTVIGVNPYSFPASSAVVMSEGRTLTAGDLTSVVIGANVQSVTFNQSMLGTQIRIGGVPFRVVGVLNASGASFGGPDSDMFITITEAERLFNASTDTNNIAASSVVVVAQNGSADSAAASITTELDALHHVTNSTQDFTVTTASSLESTISTVTNSLALFLGAIASISLLVGGIGVANAMFTSVLEQTKYIGLLKSLGARSGTILKLFVYESAMVGLIGGVLGIVLSLFGSALLSSFGLPTEITPELAILGLGFSILVGVASGIVPARNAASVEPVEALRYE